MYKALFWVKKSDSALMPLVNMREQLDIDLIYSKIYLSLGEFKKAQDYTSKSLKTANIIGDSVVLMESYQNLSEIEENSGNINEAHNYFKNSVLIKNKLKAGIKSQRLNLLRTKMKFEQEKEILQLENLKNIQTQQKYFQWITAALLTTLIITLIVYISQRREKLLNKELNKKTRALENREIQLSEINATQEKFFSIVGHDLRGPITSLKELLKIMANEEDKEVLIQSLVPKLSAYANHVHFTLDNLLNWGANQMKGENITPTTLNLYSIASSVKALYSELILKKELEVSLIVDKEITAWADKEDVNVVFRNLLSNAIKFTPAKGKITLTVKPHENRVLVEFTDSGVGMSIETQKLVCDTNKHYSTFGTANEKGTGLGLMLCKTLVSRNNGKIIVVSSENNGSTFAVFLPKKNS